MSDQFTPGDQSIYRMRVVNTTRPRAPVATADPLFTYIPDEDCEGAVDSPFTLTYKY